MANITTQTIRVDLSTDKVIPSAFTHQNDTARTLVFDMYNGGMPYTMTGNTVKFAYKSPIVNGQYSVIAGASMASGTVSGNKVSVTLPVAYTQISGVGMLTMIITPTSGTVRPVNIRLVVQKSADGDDTVMGASDFPVSLYEYMDDWLEENEPTEIENIKSDIFDLFKSSFAQIDTKKSISAFDHSTSGYSGFSGFVPNSSAKPYYPCSFGAKCVDFTLTIPENQTDVWIGCELSNGAFYGGNALHASGQLRYCLGNVANIIDYDQERVVLTTNTTYSIKILIINNFFLMFADEKLVQSYKVPDDYSVVNAAILNLGVSTSIISDVNIESVFLPEMSIINTFSVLTDADLDSNWTRFNELPSNRIYCLNLSSETMTSMGFPVTRASTFISLNPLKNPTNQSYKVFILITNSTSEINQMFIAFGHGTSITPWTSIDTYNGAGYRNPLASAIFDSNSKIIFAGDSIIAGLGGTGYDISSTGGGEYIMNYHDIDRYENVAGQCWVNSMINHIETVYGKTGIKNRGVGGINTKGVLDNISTIFGDANTVILSVGTNDYSNNSNVYTYLQQIIKYCAQNNIKLMVMTNTPNNTNNKNSYNAVKGQIQRVCNDVGIPCYDMYSEMEMYMDFKGLSLADVLNSDGIHPNDVGYDIMYKCALKLFGI